MNCSISILDFDIICRICLQNRNDMSVLLTSEINCMIVACTSVQESYIDDIMKMPQQICNECYEQLKTAYQFKQKYIQSTQTLTDIISKPEIQINNEEDIVQNENSNEFETSDNEEIIFLVANDEEDDETMSKEVNNCEWETTDNQEFEWSVDNTESSDDFFNDSEIHTDSDFENYFNDNTKKSTLEKKNSLNIKGYLCNICSKICKSRIGLKLHKKTHSFEHSLHKKAHSGVQSLECSVCRLTFKSKTSLKLHMRHKHEDPDRREMCFICGKLILPISFHYHLSLHRRTGEKYKCSVCERSYTTEDIRRKHFREKHIDNNKSANIQYYCNICNKGYKLRCSLRRHIRQIHTIAQRTYKCQFCDKSFQRLPLVKAHIDRVHKDYRPHSCSTCNKAFQTTTALRNHMACHTDERPYSCDVCGKSFKTKLSINTHLKVHSK